MLTSPYPYVVSYDLKQPAHMYGPLFEELKKSNHWWHYLTSTWLVSRLETLVELRAKLVPLIYQGDYLLILPAKGPADGWLPREAFTWIQDKLPREW